MVEIVSVVALITSSATAIALILKYISKSDCFGIHVETRDVNSETQNLLKNSNNNK